MEGILDSSLLNNCSGQSSSELPLPAAQDLQIQTDPPTQDETVLAVSQMKTNKAAGLDAAITAEALQNGGDEMIDVVHRFCAEVYSTLTPPNQWTTSVIVLLPKKGDLSQMTNYVQRNIPPVNCSQGVQQHLAQSNPGSRGPHPKEKPGRLSPWQKLCPADPHPQKDNGRIPRLSAPTHCHLH